MQVPLDGKAEPASHGSQLGQAHIAKLREAETQITKSKRMVVVVRINLGQQPGCTCIRREQFDHGQWVKALVCEGLSAVGQ